MEDEFELEFELELDELFDEELELEFDELFDEELLDELEELLPATMMEPSLWPPACLWTDCAGTVLCFACACAPAKAATPATRAALSFQWFFMPVTPC
ncbi:hypothetical protein J2Z19_001300 [Ensifer adhaerens]|uniref:Uncharacterized protein n=1 Tax=Ensifer adhaerens TaxID=106592 RepID=A0ACC5SRU6_ENSAD|nr:hypothetical protein [Ensifer adhaerens]MBP1871588.1 hypothetical protein [Ensifer adhaerens]